MRKVIITGNSHNYLLDQLHQRGFETLHNPQITYDELIRIIAESEQKHA